jgi:hypothetical protein
MFRTRLLLSGDIVKGNDTSIKYNCVLQKYNRSWGQEGISSVGGMGGETLENAEKNIVINQAFLEIGNKGKLYLGRMPVGLDDLESLYDYDPEYNMVGEKNPVLFFVGETVKWKPPNYNIFFFGSTLQEAGISAGNSDIRLWGGVYQSTSTIIHNIFFLALNTGKWGYTIGGKLGGNLETRFFPIKLNGIGVFQFGKDYSSIDLRGKAYLIEANLKVNKKVIEEFGVIYARGSADDPETPDTNEGFYDLNFSPEYSFSEIYGKDIQPNIGIQGISIWRLGLKGNFSFLSDILSDKLLSQVSKDFLNNNKINILWFPYISLTNSSIKEKNIGSELDFHIYPCFFPELKSVKWRITYAVFYPGGYWSTISNFSKRDNVNKFLVEMNIRF